ncbi:GNAT family N-acetyltransferase [Tannockella kyphosi]|uniref:GNAT family N-acetyltransferase n=1 Tax=Tannockella kyphosi TaxID=2899121 RepID=UPI0020115CA0|nr:GNAT family N-acetyltransferase [Tannockella kyphosi]
MNLQFRQATKKDIPTILFFIKQLAVYEDMLEDVQATESLLEQWLFDNPVAFVLLGSVDGSDVGIAIYFTSFSTFLAKPGIYLEDLFILKEHRHLGYGKQFLQKLASICKENDYGRLEWACLDWNQPSIDFYLSLGAIVMKEWSTYRLTGDALEDMANKK